MTDNEIIKLLLIIMGKIKYPCKETKCIDFIRLNIEKLRWEHICKNSELFFRNYFNKIDKLEKKPRLSEGETPICINLKKHEHSNRKNKKRKSHVIHTD